MKVYKKDTLLFVKKEAYLFYILWYRDAEALHGGFDARAVFA